jgi:murein DD-endopeptidase MepM/ murein hydrolase activator NlpD
MKKLLLFLLLAGVSTGVVGAFLWNGPVDAKDSETEAQEPQVIIEEQSHTIQEGDTFTAAAEELGISYTDALAIVEAAEGVFDFTRIQLGKELTLITEDGIRTRLEYEPTSSTVAVVYLQETFRTEMQDIQFDIEVKQASGTIEESLFLSMTEAGLPDALVIKFADILAWEIDFATQVQAGDEFYALYEERSRDGEKAGIGDILKADFTNNGRKTTAYRYIKPDGDITYYSEDGTSLVRPFLKAPLSFSRITSGYSYGRFHPVLKRNMPHRAIDYGAPTGTPIMAVADGTITFAGWSSIGYGNFVKIKHNGIYGTNYAHLHNIYVSPGEFVEQGDIIGTVGSTGYSTGPHLHYEVTVYGELKNPLEVEFPEGDPLSEEERDEFEQQKAEIDKLTN